jgi:hypothetical protein
MKNMMWQMYLASTLITLALFGPTAPTFAQDRGGASDRLDRLDRLERRVNEMAERQEQFMHRTGAQERRGAMAGPLDQNVRPSPPPLGAPAAPPHDARAAKLVKCVCDTLGLLFVIGILCNILLTIWIFTDIRKRGEGSGIFVALALVAGIPAAIIYALTRIADKKA